MNCVYMIYPESVTDLDAAIYPQFSFPTPSLHVKVMLTTADGQGNTALHEAVRYNHFDVVKVLLEEDPGENSLHTPNKDGETPLYMAAYRGHLDLVKAICEIRIPPPYAGPDGKTALHAAIINQEKECVKYLLWRKPIMIKEADIHGCTAFHYAASDSSAEILKDLLKVDKSVAYRAEKFGNKTPMHVAAIQDNFTALKELIESCPDSCCMIDKSGRNVLHFVAEFCSGTRTIEFVLQQYPEIFGSSLLIQKDIDGNTPLHLLNKLDSNARKIMRKYTEDKEEFNRNHHHHHHTPVNKDGGNTIKQLISEETRNDDGSDRTQRFLKAIRDEKLKMKVDDHIKSNEEIERVRKTADTHMIVAALVTTVTFAAGFTLPGGYDGNEGPNEGLAILVRKHAFMAFMVTDTIGLLCSIASLLMYFLAADLDEIEELITIYTHAAQLNIIAIGAMMLTFVTGTYVVLAHSLGLAITVCLIGCSFFIFMFVLLKQVWKGFWFLFRDFLLMHR